VLSFFLLAVERGVKDVHPANPCVHALDFLVCQEDGDLVVHYAVDTARVSLSEARDLGGHLARAAAELAALREEVPEKLTPAQTGMLLHSVARHDSLGGVEQTIIDLRGEQPPQ